MNMHHHHYRYEKCSGQFNSQCSLPTSSLASSSSSSSSLASSTSMSSFAANSNMSSNFSNNSINNNANATSCELEKRKRLFSKELRCMMYGFGDDLNPYTESVDMIEDLVLQFIHDIALKALNFGSNDKISVEDLLFILRKDTKKYSRLKDLLEMNHELRQARKAFDEIKYLAPNNNNSNINDNNNNINSNNRE